MKSWCADHCASHTLHSQHGMLLCLQVRGVKAQPGVRKECWPDIWRYSAGGRVGLALLGIAFTIATCIQLQGVLTRQWHKDYRWGPSHAVPMGLHMQPPTYQPACT